MQRVQEATREEEDVEVKVHSQKEFVLKAVTNKVLEISTFSVIPFLIKLLF